jgi:hypothetical protein
VILSEPSHSLPVSHAGTFIPDVSDDTKSRTELLGASMNLSGVVVAVGVPEGGKDDRRRKKFCRVTCPREASSGNAE